MSNSDSDFLGFENPLHFVAFITHVLYDFVPLAFIYQSRHNVIKKERTSVIGITCLYFNAFIYFFTSLKHNKRNNNINPIDFCNLAGTLFGFFYFIYYHIYFFYKNNLKRVIISISLLIIISIVFLIIILVKVEEEEHGEENNSYYRAFNWFFGTIFNIFENLPLGFDIIYLIKNKVSEKYTLFGATIGLFNTTVWLAWAIIKLKDEDKHLEHSIVANILGICLHILQFVLFFKFRNNKNNGDENESIVEGSLSKSNDVSVKEKKVNDTDEEKKVYEENKDNDNEKNIIEEFI
jgi:hypothetical protein